MDRPRSRKKRNYVDFKPRLRQITDIREDATGIGTSKIDYAIRLGLGDPDQIYYYRQCIADPERAVTNPVLRRYVAEVTERCLHLIFSDPQMWTRAQTLLRRMYPTQVASRMSEAAYNSLDRRAASRGVPMAALLEVWDRGYREGGEDAAFARASSFIDGGTRDSDLRGVELLSKIRRALGDRDD